ncbi:MAG: pyridoxal phosphate-dependent decarboxylase family protein [Nitriliruptorales bacterium]
MDLGDMPTGELRAHGHALVDWVADYLGRVGDLPVLPTVRPGEIRSRVPAAPPASGEPMEEILADLDRVVLPGITHWNHPRFHAYFAITASGPGILGELAAAALNVNAMLWRTSPAATELEQAVTDWVRHLLGLPEAFRGVILDTASTSTLVALAAARERRFPGVREDGPAGYGGAVPRVYCSEQAHSSVEKAAITAGIGRGNVVQIATDDEFRMDPKELARAIGDDLAASRAPIAVVATVGTTATTSVDPVPDVAEICARHGIWLHVDAAYGGVAAIAPERREVLAGADRADSFVVNPHKWLFTPIDCSVFLVRDPDAIKRAFRLVPDYLATDDEDVEALMDWGFQLGRRFRALKLWMVLRWFGSEGVAARIREHLRLAEIAVDWIDESEHFERVAPTPFSTVCFRALFDGVDAAQADDRNRSLLDAVNATGRSYLSHAVLGGRYVLRLAIGNLRTTEDDVRETLSLLDREAARLRPPG